MGLKVKRKEFNSCFFYIMYRKHWENKQAKIKSSENKCLKFDSWGKNRITKTWRYRNRKTKYFSKVCLN